MAIGTNVGYNFTVDQDNNLLVTPRANRINTNTAQNTVEFSNSGANAEMEEMELVAIDVDAVANDVINGKYGNGEERRQRLEEAGYNPDEIQGKVNEILTGVNTYESNVKKDDSGEEVIVNTSSSEDVVSEDSVSETGFNNTKDYEFEYVDPRTIGLTSGIDAGISLASQQVAKRRFQNSNQRYSEQFEEEVEVSQISTDDVNEVEVVSTNEATQEVSDVAKARLASANRVWNGVNRVNSEDVQSVGNTIEVSAEYNLLCDANNDRSGFLGLGNKTTLVDANGTRIVYKRSEVLEDGTIEYYVPCGTQGESVAKRINPDGTIEIFSQSGEYYNEDGKKCIGSAISGYFPNISINKVIYYPDGIKEYYSGSSIYKYYPDGIYEVYRNSGYSGKIYEIHYPDGTYKEYTENSLGKYLSKEGNADGSYVEYLSSGAVLERGFFDGSREGYFENGEVEIIWKANGDIVRYNEAGVVVEERFNNDELIVNYYENGDIRRKEYLGGSTYGNGYTEYYFDNQLAARYGKERNEFYDMEGNLVAYESGDSFVVYNNDGSIATYDSSNVSVGISGGYDIDIELENGLKRCLSPTSDFVFDYLNQMKTYTVSPTTYYVSPNSISLYGDNLANFLSEHGFNLSSESLFGVGGIDTRVYYENGRPSYTQILSSGTGSTRLQSTDEMVSCYFVERYVITLDGKIEKTILRFAPNDAYSSSVSREDILASPETYASEIYEYSTKTL